MAELDDIEISDAISETPVVVTRVSDHSAEIVRSLVASGIVPGTKLRRVAKVDGSENLIVELSDGDSVAISAESAAAVRVHKEN